MTQRHDELRARFDAALVAAGATGSPGDLFDRLVERYSEPARHYHDLSHVDACLTWLGWYAGRANRFEEVELALWFHDAIYDPRASDNERRSAELARAELLAVGVPEDVVTRIAEHVEATADHDAPCGDAALVVDLDLSILGAAPAVFAEFETKVRREYAHASEQSYRAGRRRVLQGFLDRSRIYQHEPIRAELEGRARENLKRRLTELAD